MFIQFPSWRVPAVPVAHTPPGAKVVSMFTEAQRRDSIIKEHVKKFPFKEGDIVQPVEPTEFEKYGKLMISKIADSYGKLGKNEEWPSNDNPFIISVYVEKTNSYLFCTTNYLKALDA
jgi:hypothetical protein